jgi:cytochrome b involved in lipid metabolism
MPSSQTLTRDDLIVDRKSISRNELQKHNHRDSCWISIDGFVYDVTDWLAKHPGGEIVILNASGVDVTDLFSAYHPPSTRKLLKTYEIGRLQDHVVDKTTQKFRELSAWIESSDLMRVRPLFYISMVLWYSVLLAASVSCVILGEGNVGISVVLGGGLMALYLQQIAFIGHDLGHTAVFHNRRIDSTVGVFLGNICSGISVGWWKATHNAHHCATNSVEVCGDNSSDIVF